MGYQRRMNGPSASYPFCYGAVCSLAPRPQLFLLVGTAMICNLAIALNYHRDRNGIGVFFMLSYVSGLYILDLRWTMSCSGAGALGGPSVGARAGVERFLGNYERVDLSNNELLNATA